MKFEFHHHYYHEPSPQVLGALAEIKQLLLSLQKQEAKDMAQLDDQIAALKDDVAKQTTITASAVTLISGFSAQLTAAVAAAQAAGATPDQLKALTDLDTAVKANNDGLAAAVSANTPATPTP